jgi:hypothetical protein
VQNSGNQEIENLQETAEKYLVGKKIPAKISIFGNNSTKLLLNSDFRVGLDAD